jgi:hypothetical protein
MVTSKLYFDLVFLSRRIDGQLDFKRLWLGDQLEQCLAELNGFDMIGQGSMIQIAPQEHIDVSTQLVGVEKGKASAYLSTIM